MYFPLSRRPASGASIARGRPPQMAVFTSHRPCAHAGTESGRSPNPLFAEEWQVVGRGLAPAERMLFINQKRTTDGRPCKMNDRFMKTKRREQAPALRYEIDLSAKDAEKMGAFVFEYRLLKKFFGFIFIKYPDMKNENYSRKNHFFAKNLPPQIYDFCSNHKIKY